MGISIRDGISMGKGYSFFFIALNDTIITYNAHLFLVEQVVCSKHGLAQLATESSYRFYYETLRLRKK